MLPTFSLSLVGKGLEFALATGIFQREHPVFSLLDQARLNELAHQARSYFASLVLLLQLLNLLLQQLYLYRFRLFFSFLLRGHLLLGLDLRLRSAPLTTHL